MNKRVGFQTGVGGGSIGGRGCADEEKLDNSREWRGKDWIHRNLIVFLWNLGRRSSCGTDRINTTADRGWFLKGCLVHTLFTCFGLPKWALQSEWISQIFGFVQIERKNISNCV